MEQWAAKMFQAESQLESERGNAAALGQIDLLEALRDLTYEQFAEIEEQPSQQLGPEATGLGSLSRALRAHEEGFLNRYARDGFGAGADGRDQSEGG